MTKIDIVKRFLLSGSLTLFFAAALIGACSDDAKIGEGVDSDSTADNGASTDPVSASETDNTDSGGNADSTSTGADDDSTLSSGDTDNADDTAATSATDTTVISGTDTAATVSTDTTNSASTDTAVSLGTDPITGPGTDSGWSGSDTCQVVACQGHVYQCGDCIDNDSDGGVDYRDANCLGPCDNNESGYNMEIPGGNNHACAQDCYYDQDGGAGNDQCEWDHRCDPLQPEEATDCAYKEDHCPACSCEGWYDAQPQNCLDFCGPLTPNGCDCFGCCQLDDTGDWRFLGSTGCAMDNIEACDHCTPVASCLNTCGRCEICLGKTTIPDDCYTGWDTDTGGGGGGGDDTDNTTDTDDGGNTDTSGGDNTDTGNDNYRCAPGIQPCGLEMDQPCPGGFYCITGCCQPMTFE